MSIVDEANILEETILKKNPNIKKEINRNVLSKAREEPAEFSTVDDLLDWKMDLWEHQYKHDIRLQLLFDNVLLENEIYNFHETIVLNPYLPHIPFYNQVLAILTPGEVFYGGSRGGGKSNCVLLNAIQYASFKKWKAGIFRLTYKDLKSPGAILQRAESWLTNKTIYEKAGIEPKYNKGEYTFTFPSGAKLFFGHMQHDNDVENYQGSEYHFIALDEAVQFTKYKIDRISASNRRQANDPLPLKRLYTGNPGGISHDYFKNEFVLGKNVFINSQFTDNMFLDQQAYERDIFDKLEKNDPILWRQWKLGDWNALPEGNIFKAKWFTNYDNIPCHVVSRVRYWDLAATEAVGKSNSRKPDYTAGCLLALGDDGKVYMEDMIRFQEDPDKVEENIIKTAYEDGRNVSIRVEQEGGGAAKMYLFTLQKLLQGFDFDGVKSTKSKITRAKAMLSSIKYHNLIFKTDAPWFNEFLNEITSFPTEGIHDDQVDALSGAFASIFGLDSTSTTATNGVVDDEQFNTWNRMV